MHAIPASGWGSQKETTQRSSGGFKRSKNNVNNNSHSNQQQNHKQATTSKKPTSKQQQATTPHNNNTQQQASNNNMQQQHATTTAMTTVTMTPSTINSTPHPVQPGAAWRGQLLSIPALGRRRVVQNWEPWSATKCGDGCVAVAWGSTNEVVMILVDLAGQTL